MTGLVSLLSRRFFAQRRGNGDDLRSALQVQSLRRAVVLRISRPSSAFSRAASSAESRSISFSLRASPSLQDLSCEPRPRQRRRCVLGG